MKGRGHNLALAHEHGVPAMCSEDFHIISGADNPRRADEDHFQRLFSQLGHGFLNRAVNLAAVGVASYANIERSQRSLRWVLNVFRQQDGARASTESGLGAHEV